LRHHWESASPAQVAFNIQAYSPAAAPAALEARGSGGSAKEADRSGPRPPKPDAAFLALVRVCGREGRTGSLIWCSVRVRLCDDHW
jgi:hypothetical protein